MNEKELAAQVLEGVRQIARLRSGSTESFVPGVSAVKYAGRVYDETEMTNLVQSALEFTLTAGRWHESLERGLAAWFGVPRALLMSSGSSANLLAVAALMSPTWGDRRLRRGDEVITVAAGFPTTAAPIMQLGAIAVFVDISLPGYNIDVSLLEGALTSKTRAVIVAHTLGNPFDVARVVEFCARHDLWLIEDNCDAAGSTWGGRKTGTFGDLATLSFYPAHHMTTGEGGAVLCMSDAMSRVVESLRDWGRDCWCRPDVDNTCGKRFQWQFGDLPDGYDHKYVFAELGFNLKMTEMQAAIGCAQLEKLDAFVAARRTNWNWYRDALSDLEEYVILPDATEGSDPSWFGFILTMREGVALSRDALVRHLESRKIQTRMLFAGNLVRQPALMRLAVDRRGAAPYRVAGELAQTDRVMSHSFWIGVYPGLPAAARSFVAEEIRQTVLQGAVR